jgi:hypothetical protein
MLLLVHINCTKGFVFHMCIQCTFDVVCGQKVSKFFVSHMEDSMAGHVSVMEFIKN